MRTFLRPSLLLALVLTARGASIIGSPHNLSAGSPAAIKASTEPEVCVFCHTPHNSSTSAPLWNRASSGQTYVPYTSTTAKATFGQPTGDSKLCLSCHDGTIALGMVLSRGTAVTMQGGVTVLPAGKSRLGTDLSDDHPVSFTYNAALAAADGQLKSPATLTGAVRLDVNSQVQCTSCHNPHDNQFGKFLVMSNASSALCQSCHNRTYWAASSHSTSPKTWNGLGANPWPHTSLATVQANACESCHSPHTAGNKQRLLNNAGEETNCYTCHNANVAAKNIQTEFAKASVHPIASTTGVHDPTEDPVNSTRHVECVDCHNPHAANATTATAPAASGPLAGVKGVNSAGTVVNPAVNQYELCFRCHADSTNRGPARVTRQYVQTNTRLEFQSTNQSYHSVLAAGKSTTVPGLIAPWTATSRMYCTDCHNNNQGPGAGGTGPKGPHGSAYTPLLERNQLLTDNTAYSTANFSLCFKCHSSTAIQSTTASATTTGFRYHWVHINTARAACTTCHDPHGVSANPKLINFNTTYVTKNTLNNPISYTKTGTYTGTCNLMCHGEDHKGASY